MAGCGYTLFRTSVGVCGLLWGEHGLLAVQLPEANESATRARLERRCPGAQAVSPPPSVQRAVDAIKELLSGAHVDLSELELDMRGLPEFHRRVYALARKIPAGKTMTYGELARGLGAPGSARAVGQALGRNPFAIVVPCHRVLAAGGKMGGFSATGGVSTKQKLLAIEGAQINLPHAG